MELETWLRGIFRGTKCVDSNRTQFNRLLKAVGREAKTNCSLWTLLSPGICKQMRQIRRFTPKLRSKCTQSSSHLSKPQWTSSILCHVHSKPQFILPFVRFHYVPSQFLISLSIFSAVITQMLKCEIQKMGSRRFLSTCPAFERKEQRMQNKNNQRGQYLESALHW